MQELCLAFSEISTSDGMFLNFKPITISKFKFVYNLELYCENLSHTKANLYELFNEKLPIPRCLDLRLRSYLNHFPLRPPCILQIEDLSLERTKRAMLGLLHMPCECSGGSISLASRKARSCSARPIMQVPRLTHASRSPDRSDSR